MVLPIERIWTWRYFFCQVSPLCWLLYLQLASKQLRLPLQIRWIAWNRNKTADNFMAGSADWKWKSAELGGDPPLFWVILGLIGLKNSKGPKKLHSFEPKSAQFKAKNQRRERERNFVAFRVYIQCFGLGWQGKGTEFSTAWIGWVCTQIYSVLLFD